MTTLLEQLQRGLGPEWLAHRYDPQHDAVHFVTADRQLRRRIPFLTDENLGATVATPLVATRADARAAALGGSAPVHFIFHSAYCCSTLLANLFDRNGTASAIKEPVILNDLVGWRHRGGPTARIGEVLDHSLALLARPFEPGEAVVIKPSNLINGLASAMLTLRPEARAILLYAPLELYLASIAGKGLWGRRWVRDLLMKQLKEGLLADLGFEPDDYFLQTDLQVAAVGWLAQHRLFASLAARWPDRVRTLDSEVLMARPAEALLAIGRLFGLALDEAAAAEILASDAFTRNAKDGARFGAEDRRANQRRDAELHADELEKVRVWAAAVADSAGVSLKAPAPLLG